MNNKGIRTKVLLYVEANPGKKRAEIVDALGLEAVQVSNALAYFRLKKQLFASDQGCATTWTAVRPEAEPLPLHPLMSAFYG